MAWFLGTTATVCAQSPEALWLREALASDRPPVVLDVRTPGEYAPDHLPSAVNLPVGDLTAESAARVIPGPDVPVVVYCQAGVRARKAATLLEALGYQKVLVLGGIGDWPFGTLGDLR